MKVVKFCKKVVHVLPNSYVSMTVYLADGLWAVLSSKTLRFSVTCEQSTPLLKTLVTKSPLDMILLEKMCRAENDFLSLMPYYKAESTDEITDGLVTMLNANLNSTSIEIWKPFFKNISSVQARLRHCANGAYFHIFAQTN